MAARKDYRELYEDQKDKQISDGFDDIKGDIKEVRDELRSNTNETRKINGRLSKVEDKVFPGKPATPDKLPPFYKDPALIKLLTLIATAIVVLLLLVASFRGVKIPGL